MKSFLSVWRIQSYTLQQSFLQWTDHKISPVINLPTKRPITVTQAPYFARPSAPKLNCTEDLCCSRDEPIGLGTSKLASKQIIAASNLSWHHSDKTKKRQLTKISLHTFFSLTHLALFLNTTTHHSCSSILELLPDHHFDGIHTNSQSLLFGYVVGYPSTAVGYLCVKVHPPTRRWLSHYEDINLQKQQNGHLVGQQATHPLFKRPAHPKSH